MNVGHEEEELKPYSEPELDLSDVKRIGKCLHTVRGAAVDYQRVVFLWNGVFKILHYHLNSRH